MLKYDYHIHTAFSTDALSGMDDVVKAAVGRGLIGIALTDHDDYLFPEGPYNYEIDFSEYWKEFDRVSAKYSGQIELRRGVEIGIGTNPALIAEIARFASSWPFDFIIGSIHDINGDEMHKEKIRETFLKLGKRAAYGHFLDYAFESLKAAAGLYDVAGHLDYVSRYGPFDDPSVKYREYKTQFDKILKLLIDGGKGLEVNTSGYRYGIGTVYPQPEILAAYRRLGGELLTVGSDAHAARDVAADFGKAERIIKDAGFGRITVFRERKPEFIRI